MLIEALICAIIATIADKDVLIWAIIGLIFGPPAIICLLIWILIN